jgi:hypothetical protein
MNSEQAATMFWMQSNVPSKRRVILRDSNLLIPELIARKVEPRKGSTADFPVAERVLGFFAGERDLIDKEQE